MATLELEEVLNLAGILDLCIPRRRLLLLWKNLSHLAITAQIPPWLHDFLLVLLNIAVLVVAPLESIRLVYRSWGNERSELIYVIWLSVVLGQVRCHCALDWRDVMLGVQR
jgi:hypothetical protein